VIRAAAIDVWYRYPSEDGVGAPSDLPFVEPSNLLMTPHIGGWTEVHLRELSFGIAERVARALEG